MTELGIELWPWNWVPLIFLGFVAPCLLLGRFRPALVRQRVIEFSLPLGALSGLLFTVNALSDLADPSSIWVALSGVTFITAIWWVLFVGARALRVQAPPSRVPLPANSRIPVVAVLCLLGGWWATVAMTSEVMNFVSFRGLGVFVFALACLIGVRVVRGESVGVQQVARLSVVSGCGAFAASTIWMLVLLDDPSALGPAVAQGLLASMYGFLLHVVLMALLPLSRAPTDQRPSGGMVLGYGSHFVLTTALWVILATVV